MAAGPEDYATDVMATKSVEALRRAEAAGDTQPFFLYLAVGAPHTPAFRHPKYEGQFQDLAAPRTASFNEGDVSDKPAYLQDVPALHRSGRAPHRLPLPRSRGHACSRSTSCWTR